ncbi:hypothetical protein EC973_001219 [Apophysomyces ossiformis]|uniref:alpha-L-fucosidase n=1 Tax=Apophysomyces ossiformis TaxID=679940 RepID=A0A8H7BJU1_9FUNG|nr:hypothetical protein EC973_001219 [Apophysomyces ossiformis]
MSYINTFSDDFVQLDLSKFVNNRGFGQGGDFDGLGNYFKCKQLLSSSSLNVGTIPFKTRIAIEGEVQQQDNAMARGQVITLPNDYFGALYMLVSANHGPVMTKMVVTYQDGSQSTTTLTIPDWQVQRMDRYNSIPCQVNTGATGALFSVPVFVDPSKALSHLTFPYTDTLGGFRPALHVFAITLVRESDIRIIQARSTTRWTGKQENQVIEVQLHNSASVWGKDIQVEIDGPLVKTAEPGRIVTIAPGHLQKVDVAVHTVRKEPALTTVNVRAYSKGSEQMIALPQQFSVRIGLPYYNESESSATLTRSKPSSLQQHDPPAWLQEAKFGIFIHWGVYAVPSWAPVGKSYAEWYWWQMNQVGSPTYEYHRKMYGEAKEYDQFLKDWDPNRFDPHQWLDLVDASKARYYVFTTKHHDGIALFDTKVSRRSTPNFLKRNFVRELLTVSQEKYPHLKRGLYFSMPEWYNPTYNDPSLGWHGPPHNAYTDKVLDYTGSLPIYDFVNGLQVPQILELIDNYKPDILWCDIGGINNSTVWQSKFFNDARAEKRQVSINDRCGNAVSDFQTIEYEDTTTVPSRFWEATRGIDPYSFGYNHATRPDEYASSNSLIQELVNVNAKGGNFLLNIGPESSGIIPDVMVTRLRDIGEWLEQVGPSIFESEMYWVTTFDDNEPGQPLRFAKRRDGSAFYIFSLERPVANKVVVKAPIPIGANSRITMLTKQGGPALKWKIYNNGRLIISVPDDVLDQGNYVWVFEISYL